MRLAYLESYLTYQAIEMQHEKVRIYGYVLHSTTRKEQVAELKSHNTGTWDEGKEVSLVRFEDVSHQ